MNRTHRFYIRVFKATTATRIGTVAGVVIALLVNYLTGSDSQHKLLIFVSCVLFGFCSVVLTLMRETIEGYYQVAKVNQNSDQAWIVATSPTQGKNVRKFYALFVPGVISFLVLVGFIINDYFFPAPKNDHKELMTKLTVIQHSLSEDNINGVSVLNLIRNNGDSLNVLQDKIDSLLNCCCKEKGKKKP